MHDRINQLQQAREKAKRTSPKKPEAGKPFVRIYESPKKFAMYQNGEFTGNTPYLIDVLKYFRSLYVPSQGAVFGAMAQAMEEQKETFKLQSIEYENPLPPKNLPEVPDIIY